MIDDWFSLRFKHTGFSAIRGKKVSIKLEWKYVSGVNGVHAFIIMHLIALERIQLRILELLVEKQMWVNRSENFIRVRLESFFFHSFHVGKTVRLAIFTRFGCLTSLAHQFVSERISSCYRFELLPIFFSLPSYTRKWTALVCNFPIGSFIYQRECVIHLGYNFFVRYDTAIYDHCSMSCTYQFANVQYTRCAVRTLDYIIYLHFVAVGVYGRIFIHHFFGYLRHGTNLSIENEKSTAVI